MGIFDNVKSALGIGLGSLDVVLADRSQLGDTLTGTVTFTANKNVNVVLLGVRLIHRFYAESMLDEMILDELALVERASFGASETVTREFELILPFEAVPTAPGFSWHVEALVQPQSGDLLSKKVEARVEMSVVGGGIHHVLQSQFGFKPTAWEAMEDGLVIGYEPDAAVRRQFGSLQVLYDEGPDELEVGFNTNFTAAALHRMAENYDEEQNIVWLSLRRSEFVNSGADYQAIYAELRPLFAIE